jgi:cytochrome d ubiquinol oxidase subunit II
MPLEHWVAGALMLSLTLYALGGGADFGGGVWDLLAAGPRARDQRDTIAHAIGPIWEANHVWLVLAIVLLFTCFPVAFARLTTLLHVPLTLMLLGIVFRGSAFAFRSYDDPSDAVHRRWSRLFAVGSTVTPVTLGLAVGAIASGALSGRDARGVGDFFRPWLAPFPLAVGAFTLALFAFLAAVYLTHETDRPALQDDFRRRALAAGVTVGALAFLCLALARDGAPLVFEGLTQKAWSLPFQVTTGLVAVGTLGALWTRRFALARSLAIGQVTLILWGWAFAQFPYVVAPDLTFTEAAAPPRVLRAILVGLVAGAVLLLPSLAYLFRVFKGEQRA